MQIEITCPHCGVIFDTSVAAERRVRRRYTADEFWGTFIRTETCWIWPERKRSYGRVTFHGKVWLTHRLAYVLTYGQPPPDKPSICHRCNNRLCGRPDHLYAGTAWENTRDIWLAGNGRDGDRHWTRMKPERVARGSRAGRAQLTEQDIPAIRERLSSGESVMSIARAFGIGRGAIRAIKDDKTWRHI